MSGGAAIVDGRLRDGIWTGFAPDVQDAEVAATHAGYAVEGVIAEPVEGGLLVRVPVPAAALSDGVQTVIVTLDGAAAGGFVLTAGTPWEGDVLAELSQLRAEVDMLKRAFRRHLREDG